MSLSGFLEVRHLWPSCRQGRRLEQTVGRPAGSVLLLLLLWAVACGSSEELTPTPRVTASASTPTVVSTRALTSTPTPEPKTVVYIVKPGDTLIDIAATFDTTVEAIVAANDIQDPHFIKDGQELIIAQP